LLKLVPGRLEKVPSDAPFTVLVDYAHTDDALKNVLSALKGLCKGNLIVVFGCGGDRDRTKRPRMARVAEKLADYIIVTSDNPRTEQPEFIIGEIMTGFENPTAGNITHELERTKAIELAVNKAKENDIILIAGKGHENYQIIGTTQKPLNSSSNKEYEKHIDPNSGRNNKCSKPAEHNRPLHRCQHRFQDHSARPMLFCSAG
jgi:UDP-N-acetylmuramoyl-L-alanyl-D-glutamate--2,6-diaminopimelate ligase